MKTLITNTIFILFAIQLFAQSSAQFYDIGPGGASKVSDNGQYVCGSNYPSPAFLWTEAGGRINLGTDFSEGYAVSNNGVVAGRFIDSTLPAPSGNPTLRAAYFENNTWTALEGYPGYPVLDEQSYTHAYGISADGSMIVGMQWRPNWSAEACYWDNSGIHLLGQTGGGSSRANDVEVTNDGFIICGWDGVSGGADRRAFYWDPLPHFIGAYDTTYPVGECEGLSSDVSMIVGGSAGVPFLWTQSTGMQWITTAYTGGYAYDVSDDGTVVGFVDLGGFYYNAFIKKAGWPDILLLQDYLTDSLGITGLTDWYFPFANSISVDGLTIAGTAYPPGSFDAHAYVVKIDNPVPVELTSFNATFHNNTVQLSWSTAAETNNSGFAVERKMQNSDWKQLGFVKGNGTTSTESFYSFSDNNVIPASYYYRLKQVDFNGSIKYSQTVEVDANTISDFSLEQNYPNPFNPSTKISFSIPRQSIVKLSVYNLLGEKVAEPVNEVKSAGKYNIEFNGNNLSSGTYIYRLETEGYTSSRKMILIK